MNKILKPAFLPWFALAAGGIGLALRLWLLSTGFDDKGLLVSGHPADILLWVLTAAVVAVIIAVCLPLSQANKYSFNFPSTPIGAIGEAALALGILVSAVGALGRTSDLLSTATLGIGFLCVPALCFCALCRWNGKHPQFFFHGLVCVYWILRLVAQYRTWSPEPQLQNYAFQLFATVFMMLAIYQRTAFDANLGNRRKHAIYHLGTVFFCCLSLAGSKDWLLYGTCLLWALSDLCNLIPMPDWKPQLPKKGEDHDPA